MTADRNFHSVLKVIDPRTTRIWRDEFRRLIVEVQANNRERVTFEDVMLMRSFPLTVADRWVGIADTDGKHLAMIRDVSEFDDSTQSLLEEELDKRYFIPTITKVASLKIKMGVHNWDVITNRGRRLFDVRERDDYRLLPPSRLIVRDVDGNRYEIPDYLDLESKVIDQLEQVL